MADIRRRVAIVGSGISGLGVAWHLSQDDNVDITLFEAGSHFGGHAHTVDVTLPTVQGPCTHGVDVGFLVFNERTYPRLIALFETLGVRTAKSDMSFSVQSPAGGLEWSGSNLNTVFAQRRNLLRPSFWRMLRDILRFNRLTTELARAQQDAALAEPMGSFLAREGFSDAFRDGYLLPMIACIWSCPTDQMLQFPVGTLIRFCHNHGLLQVANRPQWTTVDGGSREYVKRIVAALHDARLNCPVQAVHRLPPGEGQAGVVVHSARGSEVFDEVVLACHAPQALALLQDATEDEQRVLGALRTQPNLAVLHTDTRLLPQRELAWAAWNYERGQTPDQEGRQVCLHYLINRLQPLPWAQPVLVTLNPVREPDPSQVLARFEVAHPVFDLAAVAAQAELPRLQGRSHVWFSGAWTRYGFHEDGLMAAEQVVAGLRAAWSAQPDLRKSA